MTLRVLAAAAALTLAAAPAFAADLPTRKEAPVVPMMALYNWTGFYVGVQGGWMGAGKDKVGLYTSRGAGFSDIGDLKPAGGFIGARLGYDWQGAGSPFVVGVVADFNADWAKKSINPLVGGVPVWGHSKVDWDASLRARVGYAWDRMLVYATGGVAFVHNKYRLDAPVAGAYLSDSNTHVGGTIGAGLAYAVTNAVSVGLEYRYTRVGDKKATGSLPGGTYFTRPSPSFHRIGATLDYRF
jgi:outer membrane immunogenic protein